jgi:hypothetical protein
MRQATFPCVPMSVSHTVLLHASNSTQTSFRPCLLCAESWQRRCEGLPQRQLKIHRPDFELQRAHIAKDLIAPPASGANRTLLRALVY